METLQTNSTQPVVDSTCKQLQFREILEVVMTLQLILAESKQFKSQEF